MIIMEIPNGGKDIGLSCHAVPDASSSAYTLLHGEIVFVDKALII
ncbi:hypothetical protein [Caenimonas soli]|nr:hypothetical protein [Caenimonas soli]